MAKPPRIYTRTGDKGKTGLIGGARIDKSALRIETYGTVDELSSAIGVARSALRCHLSKEERAATLDAWLAWIQDALFNLGSDLATLPDVSNAGMSALADGDVAALERAIDAAQAALPPLANFIHPGGSLPGAQLHFARTICRRAERLLVALTQREQLESRVSLPFLNRLSDALFVWARWINDALDNPEHLWDQSAKPPQT